MHYHLRGWNELCQRAISEEPSQVESPMMSHRSVGTMTGGIRPRTAPAPPRERWFNEKVTAWFSFYILYLIQPPSSVPFVHSHKCFISAGLPYLSWCCVWQCSSSSVWLCFRLPFYSTSRRWSCQKVCLIHFPSMGEVLRLVSNLFQSAGSFPPTRHAQCGTREGKRQNVIFCAAHDTPDYSHFLSGNNATLNTCQCGVHINPCSQVDIKYDSVSLSQPIFLLEWFSEISFFVPTCDNPDSRGTGSSQSKRPNTQETSHSG